MNKTTAVLSITLAAFIGALSVYCFHRQVNTQQQTAVQQHSDLDLVRGLPGWPRNFVLAPPGPPAPLISSGVPNPAPTR